MPLFAIGPRERGSELITRPLYDGIADIWVAITARDATKQKRGEVRCHRLLCEAVCRCYADQLCRM